MQIPAITQAKTGNYTEQLSPLSLAGGAVMGDMIQLATYPFLLRIQEESA